MKTNQTLLCIFLMNLSYLILMHYVLLQYNRQMENFVHMNMNVPNLDKKFRQGKSASLKSGKNLSSFIHFCHKVYCQHIKFLQFILIVFWLNHCFLNHLWNEKKILVSHLKKKSATRTGLKKKKKINKNLN